jgi:hypothetical protein
MLITTMRCFEGPLARLCLSCFRFKQANNPVISILIPRTTHMACLPPGKRGRNRLIMIMLCICLLWVAFVYLSLEERQATNSASHQQARIGVATTKPPFPDASESQLHGSLARLPVSAVFDSTSDSTVSVRILHQASLFVRMAALIGARNQPLPSSQTWLKSLPETASMLA